MLLNNKKDKIIFDHLPKTGGSALTELFVSILGKNNVANIFIGKMRESLLEFKDYLLISGHFNMLYSEGFDQKYFYTTILRHPIDRVLSAYFFYKFNDNALKLPSVYYAKSLTLEQYLESEEDTVRNDVSNSQTKHFLGIEWDGSKEIGPVEQLILAKNALHRYDLVGDYNKIDEFIDVLCYERGWSPVKEIPRVNITSKRPKLSEIDPKIIRRLEELNQLDIALYEYATQLFNEKKRQVLHECIERRHRELNAQSIYLAPSSQPSTTKEEAVAPSLPVPLPPDEGSSNATPPADFGNRQLEILTIEVKGDISLGPAMFSGETAYIRVIFRAHIDANNLTVGIHIHDRFGRLAYGVNSECLGHTLHVRAGGVYFIDYGLRNDLGIGEYTIGAALHLGGSHLSGCFHWRDEVTRFEVVGNIGYHFEGVAKLYPQLRCGVLEGDPAGIQTLPVAHDWPRLQQIAIHTPQITEFNARLHLPEPLQRLSLHQVISVEADITNASGQTWGSTGQRPVHLSYHWQAPDGGWLEFDGERTPLPRDLAPGDTIRHFLIIKAPPQPGPARLHLTLVQEGVGWFDQHGCPALIIPVSIEE